MFDNTSDSLVLFKDAGVYEDVNPATCELFGRPRSELVGHVGAEFYVDFDSDAARQRLHAQGSLHGDLMIRRANGDVRSVEFTAKTNIVPGLHLSLFRDVTDRRAADERRRQLAAIVESSDDAIIGANTDGVITSWNGAAAALYGWSESEAIGRSTSILVLPANQATVAPVWERLRRGEVVRHFETTHVPSVPTSAETAPPGYLCSDGRRMDGHTCPNQSSRMRPRA